MITITPDYLAEQGFSQDFEQRFWSKVNKLGPPPPHLLQLGNCWLWTGSVLLPDGYGQIRPGFGENCIRTHRAAYVLQIGPIPQGLWVLHKCDVRRCVRGDHLFAGTSQENTRDCYAKGRHKNNLQNFNYPYGSNHPLSKLTWEQVDDARMSYWLGKAKIADLARRHNVRFQTMWSVIGGHTWPIGKHP